jgi:hypothetical protein
MYTQTHSHRILRRHHASSDSPRTSRWGSGDVLLTSLFALLVGGVLFFLTLLEHGR